MTSVDIQALRWGPRVAPGFFNIDVACSGRFVKYGALDSYGHQDLGAHPYDFVAGILSLEVV